MSQWTKRIKCIGKPTPFIPKPPYSKALRRHHRRPLHYIVTSPGLDVSVHGDGGLFAGLPVVHVRNFTTDVDEAALKRWAAQHLKRAALSNRSAVPARLKLSYWMRTMRRAARR